MKHLIVYVHPDSKSFCHAIKDAYTEALQALGKEVIVRDLYAENFNPVLRYRDFQESHYGGKLNHDLSEDLKIEQTHIQWADVITFIYPIWWSGMPAILKGYIDRVFSQGFAYKNKENKPVGLLSNKRVLILNTMGGERDSYLETGMLTAMESVIDNGIFKVCDMDVIGHYFYGNLTGHGEKYRKDILDQVRKIALKVSSEIGDIYY
ncbi:MAG: NAD(P)H-dependent oxidoreductase [Bacteroidales bacterium]